MSKEKYATTALSTVLLGIAMPGCGGSEGIRHNVQAEPEITITVRQEHVPKKSLKYDEFWKKLNMERLPKHRIRNPERLEDLLFAESNVVSHIPLMGLLKAECEFLTDIGCNSSGACGIGQLKLPGVAQAVSLLYSGQGSAKAFQERFPERLSMKRDLVDSLTGNYFSTLAELYAGTLKQSGVLAAKIKSKNAEIAEIDTHRKGLTDDIARVNASMSVRRKGESHPEWSARYAGERLQAYIYLDARNDFDKMKSSLEEDIKEAAVEEGKLYLIRQAINEGYAVSHTKSVMHRKKVMKLLGKIDDINDYISCIAGEDKDWLSYLGSQGSQIKSLYSKIRHEEHAETNLALADALFGYHIFSSPSLESALKKYNGGTAKRKKVYVGIIKKFYRENRNYISEPARGKHRLLKAPIKCIRRGSKDICV
jgi:hypothetical protein